MKLLLIPILIALALLAWKINSGESEEIATPKPVSQTIEPKATPGPAKSVWISDFDFVRSIASLKTNLNYIDQVLPVSYILSPALEIESSSVDITQIKSIVGETIPIFASVNNNLDPVRMTALLANQTKSLEVVDVLAAKVKEDKFTGLDLDFENINPSQRNEFSAFVRALAEKLHEKNLSLSVTLQAQTGEELATGQDMSAIAEFADFVRIMAYDVHSEGTTAGSIIPMATFQKFVRHSVKNIPSSKLVIALPTYAYDWSAPSTYSMQYADVLNIIAKYRVEKIILDEDTKSKYFKYEISGSPHTVWFEDAETLAYKIDFAKKLGITNFCFWRLGGEDPLIWQK